MISSRGYQFNFSAMLSEAMHDRRRGEKARLMAADL